MVNSFVKFEGMIKYLYIVLYLVSSENLQIYRKLHKLNDVILIDLAIFIVYKYFLRVCCTFV